MNGTASAGATAYPAELERDLLLSSGLRIHVRPIRAEDADALVAFHATLSPETVYRRYFTPHPLLSNREVTSFTRVDYHDRLALVAEVDGAIVGVARYSRTANPGEAELAVVVNDAHQHRGIGGVLIRLLVEAARNRGITRIVADVLTVNQTVLNMLRHAGFSAPALSTDGVSELVLRLDRPGDPPVPDAVTAMLVDRRFEPGTG